MPRNSIALVITLTSLAGAQSGVEFDPVVVVTLDDQGHVVALEDVDLDGHLDLVAALPDRVQVRLGDGRGTFGDAVASLPAPSASFIHDLEIDDLNGDCVPDLLITAVHPDTLRTWIGDGRGGFGNPSDHDVGGLFPWPFEVEDLDLDGHADVVIGNWTSEDVTVRYGDGAGAFPVAATYPIASFPRDVKIADFDEDGFLDLIAVNGNEQTATVFLNDGQRGFATSVVSTGNSNSGRLTTADFDLDGHIDVLMGGGFVMFGDGSGGFAVGSQRILGSKLQSGDLDLDGYPDLLLPPGCSCAFPVRLNDGSGGFGPITQIHYPGIGAARWGVLADVDEDGLFDPVLSWGQTGVGVVTIHLNRSRFWSRSPVNDHWYWQPPTSASWTQAESLANSLGGHLATVRDDAENAWLSTTYPGELAWIGLNDRANEGQFEWSSGEPVNFTAWASGEPDDQGGADYAALEPSSTTWSDEPQEPARRGIIEIDSDDCDQNGRPDSVELRLGWAADVNGDGVPDTCASPVYCSGNPNSTGQTATLSAAGSTLAWANDLHLRSESVPPGQFGYYLVARTQAFFPLFGGSQGNLCMTTPIVRFAGDIHSADSTGVVEFAPDFTALPPGASFQPGDTWNFQLWFRDLNPSLTSNTSQAIEVFFTGSAGPELALVAPERRATEEAIQFDVHLRLSRPSTSDILVPYTEGGTATDGVDWRVESTNPLVIRAGELCASLVITVAEDQEVEGDETAVVTLTSPAEAVLGEVAEFTLTIVDDD